MNFFNARLEKADGGLVVDAGTFRVQVPPAQIPAFDAHAGKPVIFGIRPEDIHDPHFSPPGIHAAPVGVKVDVTELMGNEIFLYLLAGSLQLRRRASTRAPRSAPAWTRRSSSTWTTCTCSSPRVISGPSARRPGIATPAPGPSGLGALSCSHHACIAQRGRIMPDFNLMRELHRKADSKIVLLVLDGLGGLPLKPGGPTELEAARTPNFDRLAAEGTLGQTIPIRHGITPGSGPGASGAVRVRPARVRGRARRAGGRRRGDRGEEGRGGGTRQLLHRRRRGPDHRSARRADRFQMRPSRSWRAWPR